jgi:tetratricopeptide (TPR) repeat protein
LLFISSSVFFASWTAFSADKDKEAKAAFDSAVKLFKNSSYEEAAEEFRKANAIKPTNSLLYNIGQSEAAAKRYGLAYDAFEEYLSLSGDDITEQRRNQVTAELDRLSKVIGSVEVVAPQGCTVFVDNMNRGVTPLPGRIKLAVGVIHKIDIKKDAETIYSNNVKVSFGEVLRAEVKDKPEVEVAAASTTAEEPKPVDPAVENTKNQSNANSDEADRLKPVKVAGLVSLASGGAMLAAAIATGVVALKKNAALKNDCVSSVCQGGDQSEILSRDTLALSTDVLIGVGTAAVLVGTVLFVWSKKKAKNNESVGLRMIPSAGPQVAGMSFSGEF